MRNSEIEHSVKTIKFAKSSLINEEIRDKVWSWTNNPSQYCNMSGGKYITLYSDFEFHHPKNDRDIYNDQLYFTNLFTEGLTDSLYMGDFLRKCMKLQKFTGAKLVKNNPDGSFYLLKLFDNNPVQSEVVGPPDLNIEVSDQSGNVLGTVSADEFLRSPHYKFHRVSNPIPYL